jgi:hypothetical protein
MWEFRVFVFLPNEVSGWVELADCERELVHDRKRESDASPEAGYKLPLGYVRCQRCQRDVGVQEPWVYDLCPVAGVVGEASNTF